MKNSQYVNQVDVSINDLLRLKFSEVVPIGSDKHEIVEIIMISMQAFAAKNMAELIINAINEHEKNVAQHSKKLS